MIFLSVKFEKEACLVVNITDFSPSKFFSLHKNSQFGTKITMNNRGNLKINFGDCTCIISSLDVPLLGDSPLRGGRADIMAGAGHLVTMSSLNVTPDLWLFTWGLGFLTDHLENHFFSAHIIIISPWLFVKENYPRGSEMRIVLIVNNLNPKIYLTREINWKNCRKLSNLSNLWNFELEWV